MSSLLLVFYKISIVFALILASVRFKKYLFLSRMVYNLSIKAVSSAVEHLPYKQMATGSNPVPPIENPNESFDFGLWSFDFGLWSFGLRS